MIFDEDMENKLDDFSLFITFIAYNKNSNDISLLSGFLSSEDLS